MQWNSQLYDSSHGFVAQQGQGIFDYLRPGAGEVILDLGCGTGDLTAKIAAAGARVFGIDSSADMITAARAKFPDLRFECRDALAMDCQEEFDAVFSNAVLHWIPQQADLTARLYRALKPRGRLVMEFGGQGNNRSMLAALRAAFQKRGLTANAAIDFWYYPSIGDHASLLERGGFRVRHAELFDRPTPLQGIDGMKNWFAMFGPRFFQGLAGDQITEILDEVQATLEPILHRDGVWYADYVRLRVVAEKAVT